MDTETGQALNDIHNHLQKAASETATIMDPRLNRILTEHAEAIRKLTKLVKAAQRPE